jgi:NAD(P)-dependent dehydrogenase (short-subunit alcohol dehydrogenase family)
MSVRGSVIVVGGTRGIGRQVAQHFADRDRDVVITGRDADHAAGIAGEIGGRTSSIGFDLAKPSEIAERLSGVGPVDHLVLAAIERDYNRAAEYDIAAATRLVTLKLIGYTEVVHALASRLTDDSSVVVFGGLAKDRPYPGSTTVTTVNGGVTAMVRTLAVELAPRRVNAVHPGIVGDSPEWAPKQDRLVDVRARTPTGRNVAMQDVVGAVVFLLENPSVNGVNLEVDGGWLLM